MYPLDTKSVGSPLIILEIRQMNGFYIFCPLDSVQFEIHYVAKNTLQFTISSEGELWYRRRPADRRIFPISPVTYCHFRVVNSSFISRSPPLIRAPPIPRENLYPDRSRTIALLEDRTSIFVVGGALRSLWNTDSAPWIPIDGARDPNFICVFCTCPESSSIFLPFPVGL